MQDQLAGNQIDQAKHGGKLSKQAVKIIQKKEELFLPALNPLHMTWFNKYHNTIVRFNYNTILVCF